MQNIFIRSVRDEVVAFIDRQAEELSKISGRTYSRNAYMNLILEKQLRDDLSVNEDKYYILNEKIDMLVEVVELLIELVQKYKHDTERLIGLIVHGIDIDEE